MTSMQKSDGVHSPSTPNTITGSSGHKNSLKGTKLARRARSFKDDLFEKISQMRTPTNTLGRSNSPHSPRTKNAKAPLNETKPPQGLDSHVKHVKNALQHFKDVISKNKLEVLPGNGTVVLEIIVNMYKALQPYTINEHSTTIISATKQVYLSVGRLIKLCDEVLIRDDENNCASLSNENVKEIVDLVENAVQNLINLTNEKIKEKENALTFSSANNSSSNTLHRPSVDTNSQRTSLPDIPLTPNERDILEKSSSNPMRTSHSTESILRDSSPPPKPPLPTRCSNPPPLPPKKRTSHKPNSMNESNEFAIDSTLLSCALDHVSNRSKSPDDNSSLLSASNGSLDSALNHSREEEDLKDAPDMSLKDQFLEEEVDLLFAQKSVMPKRDSSENTNASIQMTSTATNKNQRNSNESGFASMQSIRASMQSVSTKRFSEQSVQSHKSNTTSSVEMSSLKKIESISTETEVDQTMHSTKMVSCFTNQKMSSVEQCVTSCNFLKSTCTEESKIVSNDCNDMRLSTEKIINTKSVNSSICSSVKRGNSFDLSSDDVFSTNSLEDIPPALPVKTRNRSTNKERHLSQYDNVEESDNLSSLASDEMPEFRQHPSYFLQSKHQSLIDPRRFNYFEDGEQPPPLPAKKKKHILAYMEICSASTRTSSEQLRHSVHTYNLTHSSDHFSPNRNISHSHTINNLSPIRKQYSLQTSPNDSPNSEKPPALPPKKQRASNCKTPTIITTPPPSPKPPSQQQIHHLQPQQLQSQLNQNQYGSSLINEMAIHGDGRRTVSSASNQGIEMATVNEEANELNEDEKSENLDGCNLCERWETKSASDNTNEEDEGIGDVVLRHKDKNISPVNSIKMENIPNLIEEIDISDYLIFKKEGEDGPEVKGGYLDALIVHASKVQKNENDEEEDAFGEAFITTFRTFMPPLELIEKLTHRYSIFCYQITDEKKKAAKETFSLLVRVVNDLTATDLTYHLLNLLVDFVYRLVCSGQLSMAKLLRNKVVEKGLLYKEHKSPSLHNIENQRNIVINQPSLLDLKSVEIAEQMTLLDAELFQKIEIPEVLLFAKEQCEDKSPNLNKFTEHFNKMSYWARSQILKQDDAKDREKHVVKFIKIMKHLRKINNYNSYLALLSALDSAPIRRLEWHKTITEGLKEYCALIDSSSSFRVYRQALAETSPPCIPYIGLVLQDLTFVHVGNQDYLRDGIINFSKRWQQHNIIDNMKRFKKCAYPYRKNDKIIRFFENFENYLGEEQMWQISENIKPRGRKPVQN